MKSLVLSMNTIHTKRFCNRLCIGAVALLSVACNNQNEQFPPGANVTIAPSAYSWTVTEYLDDQGQCIYFSDDYQDNVMVITVADASGRPIGEMDLEIYLSPSNSTSPPQQENLHIFHLTVVPLTFTAKPVDCNRVVFHQAGLLAARPA
ncbi:MAG: hypothetical protein AB2694_14310, partial [Candidatus Thiodiazotropha sp.]